MKTFILAAASLLAVAQAQDLTTLPVCAQTCALAAIGATGCDVTDANCICSATSFLSGVQTCIATACSAADQAATLEFAQGYCLSGGVTITLPTAPATVSAPAASTTVPATAPVSQISDGQPQATTGAPVSQISDGQPQATTGAPVSQISDGQAQAPTSVAPATFSGAAAAPLGRNMLVEVGMGMLGVGVAVAL